MPLMLQKLFANHGMRLKMRLQKCQEKPTRSGEVYFGLMRGTLFCGRCVLTPWTSSTSILTEHESESDELIQNTSTPPVFKLCSHYLSLFLLPFSKAFMHSIFLFNGSLLCRKSALATKNPCRLGPNLKKQTNTSLCGIRA